MKLRSLPWLLRRTFVYAVITICLQLSSNIVVGQLPDCMSGQYMYGVFSPLVPSAAFPTPGKDSTEIRPVAFSNGAVGPLMGGRRYYIRRNPGGGVASNNYFYGSSAMAMDEVTNKFYLITQMGSNNTNDGNKDIIMIDPVAPTATGTVIATIGTGAFALPDGAAPATDMTKYHFVKAAASPGFPKYGYAIGVNWDVSGTASNRFNPLIRFPLCATAGCANPGPTGAVLLGYLESGGIMDKNNLFNGDIAFDASGNIFFFAAAYNGTHYTEARLFRIDAADIPAVPGTGVIDLDFVADFNDLDSTGASGICFSPPGNMYMTTRRYVDPTNLGAGFSTELDVSFDESTSDVMAGFGPLTDSVSAGDLASCYFPAAILPYNTVKLTAGFYGGSVRVEWKVISNDDVTKYELQRSEDGIDFVTIATISPSGALKYTYNDPQHGADKYKYYRVRQVTNSGVRYYSNVQKVRLNSKMSLLNKLHPNPIIDKFSFSADIKSSSTVRVRLLDQSGRVVFSRNLNCTAGVNNLSVTGLGNLKKGIYVAEISLDEEVIREKLIKE